MSAIIPPIPPLDEADVSNNPAGGATVVEGQAIITSPDTSADAPVKIAGSVEFAVAAPNTVVEITSDAGSTSMTTAVDPLGNEQNMSGVVVNADADSESQDLVNLEGANIGIEKVDTSIDLGKLGGEEGTTIADEAPGGGEGLEIDTYVHTAGGDDQIRGTAGDDFIRAGAGDDVIEADGGDDIVRVGSGDDIVSLGAGKDVIYLTADQLDGGANTIVDWDTVNDQIQIDADIEGDVGIGLEGDTLSIEFTNPETGDTTTTTFQSTDGDAPEPDDVEFV